MYGFGAMIKQLKKDPKTKFRLQQKRPVTISAALRF